MPDDDSPVQLSRDDWRVILTRTVHEYRIRSADTRPDPAE